MIKVISARYSFQGWDEPDEWENARITIEGHISECMEFAYSWLKATMPEDIAWFIFDVHYEANREFDSRSRLMVRARFK
jgi:hypothetical protein